MNHAVLETIILWKLLHWMVSLKETLLWTQTFLILLHARRGHRVSFGWTHAMDSFAPGVQANSGVFHPNETLTIDEYRSLRNRYGNTLRARNQLTLKTDSRASQVECTTSNSMSKSGIPFGKMHCIHFQSATIAMGQYTLATSLACSMHALQSTTTTTTKKNGHK